MWLRQLQTAAKARHTSDRRAAMPRTARKRGEAPAEPPERTRTLRPRVSSRLPTAVQPGPSPSLEKAGDAVEKAAAMPAATPASAPLESPFTGTALKTPVAGESPLRTYSRKPKDTFALPAPPAAKKKPSKKRAKKASAAAKAAASASASPSRQETRAPFDLGKDVKALAEAYDSLDEYELETEGPDE